MFSLRTPHPPHRAFTNQGTGTGEQTVATGESAPLAFTELKRHSFDHLDDDGGNCFTVLGLGSLGL